MATSGSELLAPAARPAAAGDDAIVQYVVVRKDLKGQNWTKGALIAQACHASVAAVWLSREDEETQVLTCTCTVYLVWMNTHKIWFRTHP